MHSRLERRRPRAASSLAPAVLAVLMANAPVPSSAADVAPAPLRAPLVAAAIEAAASQVRADPNLGGIRKERIWRLKPSASAVEAMGPPAPEWIVALAGWLAEGGRALVWLLGAAALAVAIVASRRWWAVHGAALRAGNAPLPSHVRELDIRPESLPADIGAAVRGLWLAGEQRAALSLLYRGALSRLVHSHAVPIGAASTEGDCLRLARARLAPPSGDFVAALVQAWQLAVYGGRPLPTAHVMALCDDFDRRLPASAATAA